MNIDMTRLSSVLFSSTKNVEFIHQLNSMLKYMIDRDCSFVATEHSAPQIWECKWLNQSKTPGYPKGYTVWLNTNTYEQLLGSKRQSIESYIANNATLNQMYNAITGTDTTARNKFLIDAAKGTASNKVSAMYYLGDVSQKAQIRISKIDNNKSYPSDLCYWEDFFIHQSYDDNVNMLLSAAKDSMENAVAEHLSTYHKVGLNEFNLQAEGFVRKDPFEVSSVQTQDFFDHTYCDEMRGFDFVKRWKMLADGSLWCKIWNSGYIEQGGFVDNIPGDALIPVEFMTTYNYPLGVSFYQRDYTSYAGQYEIDNPLQANNRYIVTVTPIMDSSAQPYPDHPINIANELLYSSVDITNMSNRGFSIVNTDLNRRRYSKYSWHVCGYKVINDNSQMFDNTFIKTTVDSTPFTITSLGKLVGFNDNGYVVVHVPENVLSIGDSVFEGNVNMKSVVLPEGLLDLGLSSFASCKQLRGVSVPDNVTAIPECAFYDCQQLVYASISEKVNFIGPSAFYNDLSLATFTRFNDPDPGHTFDKVGDYAFSKTAMKTMNLALRSAGIDNFWGDYCFAECKNLEEVNILSAGYMSNHMFSNCTSLKTVNFKNNQTSYVYPNVFDGCTALEKITLPSKLWYISEEMFKNCTSLEQIEFNDYDAKNSATNLIQKNAFNGCKKLKSLELPASLTSLNQLDDACLCGCALTSISFHGMTKSDIIGSNGLFNDIILSSGMFRLSHDCTLKLKDDETVNYVFNSNDVHAYVVPPNYLTAVNTTATSNFKTAKQCIDSGSGQWWYYNASQLCAQAYESNVPCVFIYSLLGCKPCQVYMKSIFNNSSFQNWTKKQKFYLCNLEVDKQPSFNKQLAFCVNELVPTALNFAKEDLGQSEDDVVPNALGNKYRRYRVDSTLLNSTLYTPVIVFYHNNGSKIKTFVHTFHDIDKEINAWGVDGVIECLKSLCLYYFDNNTETGASYVVDAKPFDLDDYSLDDGTSPEPVDNKYVVIPTNSNGNPLTSIPDVNAYIAEIVGPNCVFDDGTPCLLNCKFDDIGFLINTFPGIQNLTTIADVNSFVKQDDKAKYVFKIGDRYYKFSLSTTKIMPIESCIATIDNREVYGGAPEWTQVDAPAE